MKLDSKKTAMFGQGVFIIPLLALTIMQLLVLASASRLPIRIHLN
jgi:hypothetical protein